MRNKSTRQKGKKNFNFTISKFRAQRYMKIYDQQRLESPEEKLREKGGAHADMVSEGFETL